MNLDDSWILPERGAPWLTWGFGTRRSVLEDGVASIRQVHGAQVVSVTEPGVAGEGDALVTDTPGVMIGIRTADCLPVLMVDLHHKAIAAAHCGWRGTARHILSETISRMKGLFDTSPADLLIAMGPSIGKCCFEVGAEVAKEFTDFNPNLAQVTGKCHLDLQAINAWQLQETGVIACNILQSSWCTFCDPEQFYSFRREKEEAGRMWAIARIEG